MSDQNRTVVTRWFDEVWNQGRLDLVDELMSADSIGHGMSAGDAKSLTGPEAFKPIHKMFRDALKDLHIEVADMITEGDRVVTRCIVTGTHTGDFLGAPATGKKVRFEGVTISRIKDGMIAEGWNFYDFASLYRTLGVPMQ